MSCNPRIIIINNEGSISVYSDVAINVTYLDDFTTGLNTDELVTVDGVQYQKGLPSLTVSEDLVNDITAQIYKELED